MNLAFVSSWKRTGNFGGVCKYSIDQESGELTYLETLLPENKCGMSFYDPDKKILYVTDELSHIPGLRDGGGGSIHCFKVDEATGQVTELGERPTFSTHPSYMCKDRTGKFMLVTTHGSKEKVTKIVRNDEGKLVPCVLFDDTYVLLFEVLDDGMIGELLDAVKHEGDGPDFRQYIARPHSVTMSPLADIYAVCDKGNDRVYMYGIDYENCKLVLKSEPFQAEKGVLPRYQAFHPTLPYLFTNNEAGDEVYTFKYTEDGQFERISRTRCVPDDVEGPTEQQGFCISPSGKYLYDANHKTQRISVIEVQESGELRLIQSLETGYQWTRGANITPDGQFLVVCCMVSGKVITYRIKEDGTLEPTGFEVDQENAQYTSFCYGE